MHTEPIIYVTSIDIFFDKDEDGSIKLGRAFFDKAYHCIMPERREKVDRLRFAEDKCRSIAAGILLNFALRHRNNESQIKTAANVIFVDLEQACDEYDKSYDYKVSYMSKGKPYFADYPEVNFSITHAGNYAACVICDVPVGIDMEGNRENVCDVAKRFFCTDEASWVCKAVSLEIQKEHFLKLWTFKEAYSKMTGEGIAMCLKQPYFDRSVDYDVTELEFEEYRICVVKNKENP